MSLMEVIIGGRSEGEARFGVRAGTSARSLKNDLAHLDISAENGCDEIGKSGKY